MIAPQFGLFGPMPPATDNPAASRPGPPPPEVAEQMRALRAEFAQRVAERKALIKRMGWGS